MSHQKKHRPSSLQSEELKFILISAEISFQLKKSLGNIFVSLNNPENDFGIIYSKIAIFTAEKPEKIVNLIFEPIFSDLSWGQKFFVVSLK